jgi:hypothetical protein
MRVLIGTLNILEGVPDKKYWVRGRPFRASRQREMSEYQSRAASRAPSILSAFLKP